MRLSGQGFHSCLKERRTSLDEGAGRLQRHEALKGGHLQARKLFRKGKVPLDHGGDHRALQYSRAACLIIGGKKSLEPRVEVCGWARDVLGRLLEMRGRTGEAGSATWKNIRPKRWLASHGDLHQVLGG